MFIKFMVLWNGKILLLFGEKNDEKAENQ